MRTFISTTIAVLILTCLAPVSLPAQGTVNFKWTAPAVLPSGAEMRLTSTDAPPLTPITKDCGAVPNNNCTVSGIPAGAWSAVLLFYNTGVPATVRAYSLPSNAVTFSIPATPPTPTGLTIGSITVASVARKEATLLAETNLPAETEIEYGIGGLWLRQAVDSGGTSHRVTLDKLRPHTPYQYRWVARRNGETVFGEVGMFTTL